MKKLIITLALLSTKAGTAQSISNREKAWFQYEEQSRLHRADPVYLDELDTTGTSVPPRRARKVRHVTRINLYPWTQTSSPVNFRWAAYPYYCK